MKNRKSICLMLLLLILLALINWIGAVGIVFITLFYDWLFELEDKQADRDEKRYYHYLQRLEAEKQRDERIGKFMEEEW